MSLTDGNIFTDISDESNIIEISCQSKNEDFAKLLIESLGEIRRILYYISNKNIKSKNTLDFLSERADSILNELKMAEYEYAAYKDANLVQRAKGLLQEIRLKRNVEILNVMYIGY